MDGLESPLLDGGSELAINLLNLAYRILAGTLQSQKFQEILIREEKYDFSRTGIVINRVGLAESGLLRRESGHDEAQPAQPVSEVCRGLVHRRARREAGAL